MKFLCDRCKTRYSIGDDRVRGKILKIRCKNCANVITVREGMPDADAAVAADPAARNPKKTTGAPAATAALDAPPSMAARNGGSSPPGALGAAFASAMTKPPPALEEEWYVSIDGEQAGPFTLAEAQRWVAGKSFDAELHCWSEGFDDWLPVDKVSHFRGLRKKPAPPPTPAAPPPLPRVSPSGPARALHQHAPIDESEPKPLFAATMASLEKAQPVQPLGMAPALAPATTRPSATPPKGQPIVPMQARTNGAPAPLPASRTTPVPGTEPRAGKSTGVPTTTLRGAGAPAKPMGFDASENGESKTQLEAAAFDEEQATTAEPVAARRGLAPMPAATKVPSGPIATARDGFATKPLPAHQNAPLAARDAFASTLGESDAGATVPNAPSSPPVDDDDDRLDIGEVSRVVKLADIARTPRTQPIARRSGAIPAGTGSIGRSTAGVPRISTRDLGNAPTVPLDALNAPAPGMQPGVEGEAPQLQPAVVASHRRALIALIIGAVALLGAAIVVVFLVMEEDDGPTKGLGRDYVQDDTRPETQIAKGGSNGSAGALPGSAAEPVNPFVPKRPYKPPPQHIDPVPPPIPTPGDSLKTDEIEAMAKQYNTNFQICFRRADRGVGSIVLQDIKRILVSFTLNKDGTVASVTLSDNQIPELTSCLSRTVQGWKFRPGPTKSYGFTLVPPR